nr:hypothetical protein [Saprospiraceae bacterium]
MSRYLLPLALLLCNALSAQNQAPILTNVEVQFATNNVLIIQYDLADAEGDGVSIGFKAARNGASVLDFITDNATGDIGNNVQPGTGKQIEWDYSDYLVQDTTKFRLMLIADDLQPVDIQSLVDQVDSTRLYGDLSFIEGVRHRSAGAAHLQATKDFIELQFLDKALETSRQGFPYGGYTAHN